LRDQKTVENQIRKSEQELATLDAKRAAVKERIRRLRHQQQSIAEKSLSYAQPSRKTITNESSEEEKILLFQSLFRGRTDVYPKRFESKTTGRSGYQPDCRNEWLRPLCRKPRVKCGDCEHQDFIPISPSVIRNHLTGVNSTNRCQEEFVIGIYPMLVDETCRFIAVDFDKATWKEDAKAYLEACRSFGVPASLERSRSGNGSHIWIFFSEPIQAKLARQLGSFILTQAMEARPELGFDSYDRFFPSQDTMPKGGFGNLIALPLQKKAREKENSLFLDEDFQAYPDQWSFLSSIRRMNSSEVQAIVAQATYRGGVLGVRFINSDEDEVSPWLYSPSGKRPGSRIKGPLPDSMELVLGNQIYIAKEGLSPQLKNSLIRLAAFQNPEFYRAQAMRFPTFGKPRIVHCCEDFPKHLGIPRGCLEDIVDLLGSLRIEVEIKDERYHGVSLDVEFRGTLRPDQKTAADAVLKHDTGVLSAATAFGKTVVAAHVIAKRSVNTLVLVHRKELLKQWIERMVDFLDIPEKSIGQIGGGKRRAKGMIDVAMIQSLSRKGVVDDIVAEYGHLVVDECHHVSARSFEIVARQSRARYVTGLSATVIRKDGHHPIIFMNCGPVRYRFDERKQAAARPFVHRVIVKKTDFLLPSSFDGHDYSAIHKVYQALMKDDKRNQLITNDILQAIANGRFPVILTERKEHLEMLKNLLSSKIQNLIVMKGGMRKRQRQDAQSALQTLPEDAEKAILATGKYLGEGFDDPGLDTLFLTLPISWKGTLAQYAGRLHRVHDMKKEVIIYDYADLEVSMLRKMYEKRLSGYKAIGYEISA